MRNFLLALTALTLFPAHTAPAEPPLCPVTAVSTPQANGRRLEIMLRPGCPANGEARVRLASRWGGHLPERQPGVFVIRPGERLVRISLPWWWAEWIDRSGRAWRIREEAR